MAKSGLIERQFMLSLVQTAEGLPVAHEVHPGNTAEAKTLLPMIRGLLARYPLKRVVLIADRGLLSTANIDELGKLQAQLKKDGGGARPSISEQAHHCARQNDCRVGQAGPAMQCQTR